MNVKVKSISDLCSLSVDQKSYIQALCADPTEKCDTIFHSLQYDDLPELFSMWTCLLLCREVASIARQYVTDSSHQQCVGTIPPPLPASSTTTLLESHCAAGAASRRGVHCEASRHLHQRVERVHCRAQFCTTSSHIGHACDQCFEEYDVRGWARHFGILVRDRPLHATQQQQLAGASKREQEQG